MELMGEAQFCMGTLDLSVPDRGTALLLSYYLMPLRVEMEGKFRNGTNDSSRTAIADHVTRMLRQSERLARPSFQTKSIYSTTNYTFP